MEENNSTKRLIEACKRYFQGVQVSNRELLKETEYDPAKNYLEGVIHASEMALCFIEDMEKIFCNEEAK